MIRSCRTSSEFIILCKLFLQLSHVSIRFLSNETFILKPKIKYKTNEIINCYPAADLWLTNVTTMKFRKRRKCSNSLG